jgi:hypothetical protein
MVAALQKGRRVNGRICSRQVHLGPAGQLTKEKLWERSLELERKLAGFPGGGDGQPGADQRVAAGDVWRDLGAKQKGEGQAGNRLAPSLFFFFAGVGWMILWWPGSFLLNRWNAHGSGGPGA